MRWKEDRIGIRGEGEVVYKFSNLDPKSKFKEEKWKLKTRTYYLINI